MGKQADEALAIDYNMLPEYLYANHSAYMQVGTKTYYLTDVNDSYWRAQDTNVLNEKDHFVDASDLVSTVSEFVKLPFVDGKTIEEVFDRATFYASVK
ncbi:MAG: CDP-alcohol phosphatidyltransferase [Raoultibacter sp.]